MATWVWRQRAKGLSLPDEFVAYLIRSEYATLKFLETTAVPAPRVFAYGVRGGTDHGVGVGFILMEELPGEPWTGFGASGDNATAQERAKVWKSVADILAELAKHPFPKAGSLFLAQESRVEVSATASDRFLVLSPEGPFETAIAYYTAFAEQHLALIADGQLYATYPVDAYLVYQFLKDNAWQLAERDAGPQEFFLKHVDDKGDHLLVDENLNVTGVIDWQMARVVPRYEAFGASLVTASMSSLCRGRVSLSEDDVAIAAALEERGAPELAKCMADEKVRRFFWGLALEPKWSYALPLANAILGVFGAGQVWEEWREGALKGYETDERLTLLLQRTNTQGEE
ncbi:aminoglycoside phosphotransferase [Lasiosphaeria ovina]|uniref:Aminoglycoside phosphotransferase n=1 Tax=Lasiosphaeria ovina TaxID=92902 RepID=A0AAE0KIP9_9PEZI|nr:aminoglycoside phosphotransferase [Lasiosphaeria ovina]